MATIKSTLSLQDKMSSTLNKVQQNAIKSIQVFNQMSGEVENLKKTMESAQKINPSIVNTSAYNQASAALGQMESKLQNVANGTEEMVTENEKNSTSIQSLTSNVMNLVSAYVSLQSLKAVVSLSDQYVQANARLDMMNDGLQTTAELQNMIYESAQRSRTSVSSLTSTVAALGNQAKDAFGSSKEIVAFGENLNKLFTVSGMDDTAIESVMYNLTQSLSSGKLLGNDYRILKQNAPQMIQYLQDFYGVSRATLDDMVSDGKVTAEGIKQAMFNATDDINNKFNSMPTTWGQLWTTIKNQVYEASIPILNMINQIAQNWDLIRPVVVGVAAAVGIYTAAIVALNVVSAIHNGLELVAAASEALHAGKSVLATAAITTEEGAVIGLNAALLACPLTWILLAIIAVIAAVYLIVAAINKLTGSSISATGIIMGVVYVVGAYIYNRFAILANFLANIFTHPIASIEILFLDLANFVVKVLAGIASLIDKIFGSNLASTVNGWSSGIEGLKTKIKDESGYNEVFKSVDYSTAFSAGYTKGSSLFSGSSSSNALDTSSLLNSVTGTDSTGSKAVKTTTNDDLLSDDDIQLLLDVATRDYKLNYQQVTPEITLTFGDIRETADVDNILDEVATRLEEIYDGNLEVG